MERDRRTRAAVLVGVDVQVAEVAVAQRDQVAVGAEVGLQVGRPARRRAAPSAVSTVSPPAVQLPAEGARRSRRRAASSRSLAERLGRERRRRPAGRRRARAARRRSAGSRRAPARRPASELERRRVHVAGGAVEVGCTCWNPVRSRRTTMRCRSRSCCSSYAVTGVAVRSGDRERQGLPARRRAGRRPAAARSRPPRPRARRRRGAPWPPSPSGSAPRCRGRRLRRLGGDRTDEAADAEGGGEDRAAQPATKATTRRPGSCQRVAGLLDGGGDGRGVEGGGAGHGDPAGACGRR